MSTEPTDPIKSNESVLSKLRLILRADKIFLFTLVYISLTITVMTLSVFDLYYNKSSSFHVLFKYFLTTMLIIFIVIGMSSILLAVLLRNAREKTQASEVILDNKRSYRETIYTSRHYILTEKYLDHNIGVSLLASILLILIAIFFLGHRVNMSQIICFFASAIIFAHGLLTTYRVRHGYFGSNSTEAIELISFVIKHAKNHKPPPGSKVSREYASDGKDKILVNQILPDLPT